MVTDWSWTSEASDSCWNKFHKFYQPHGLFNRNSSLAAPNKCKFASYIYTSPMYQKKYTALGIQVKLKGGREVGMGRNKESLHIVKSKREHEKVHNEPDDENEITKK